MSLVLVDTLNTMSEFITVECMSVMFVIFGFLFLKNPDTRAKIVPT